MQKTKNTIYPLPTLSFMREPLEPTADRLERAQDCQEWENQTALYALQVYRDIQIEQARTRRQLHLDKICADCRNEIGLERLRAQPTATRCVKCQAEYAKRNLPFGAAAHRRHVH